VATPDSLAGIAAVLRAAQCAVVPNCAHLSHEEAPQQLLELLVQFARQHLADPASAGEA
jgi:pimeloyl-ACP methyl ester carboxylesterase